MLIVLQSLDDLDAAIAEADASGSDDQLRQRLATFEYSAPLPGGDPFSAEYRAGILDQYAHIAGKSYGLDNELLPFDMQFSLRRPFPYSTGSFNTVSDNFLQIAYLLKVMAVPAIPSGHIIDMGPGWGNTTEMLARTGYDVTAIDVNPDFCDLTRERLARIGVQASVICGDFLSVEKLGRLADGVVFFESFHHCLDHVRLLEILHRKTTPDAVMVFAGEPISAGFDFPWGIRPDGMAVWSVRKFGWLELGFSEDYFRDLLNRTGWKTEPHCLPGFPFAPVWRTTKL